MALAFEAAANAFAFGAVHRGNPSAPLISDMKSFHDHQVKAFEKATLIPTLAMYALSEDTDLRIGHG